MFNLNDTMRYFLCPGRTNMRKDIDKTGGGIRQPLLTATYRFNKTMATATIRFIVAVAIVI